MEREGVMISCRAEGERGREGVRGKERVRDLGCEGKMGERRRGEEGEGGRGIDRDGLHIDTDLPLLP
jgi:hypothetical protein